MSLDGDIVLFATDRTVLHVAAMGGRVALVEALLARGADVNVKDKKGDTPLHRAIVGRSAEVKA